MDRSGSGGRATKDMVLRLDPALAERLRLVAEVERRSVSDVAREAVAALVERRRSDRRFQALLEENLARHSEALRLLRDGPDTPRAGAGGA
jgi:predicted transcriptional regulator